MTIPILVVGSSNTDMVVKVERLPVAGETVIGGTFLMNPGGKGANQAVACARLGGSVTFLAKVGNDIFGKQALQQFQKESINTTFVTTESESPSGVALIGVDGNGENSIIVAPGANGLLDTRMVSQALESVSAPAIVLAQLEVPIATVEFTIEQAYAKGLKVILNPAPAQVINLNVLRHLYLITPNETEAELLTGVKVVDTPSAELAAKKLFEQGVPNVVITLGRKGAYLYNASGGRVIPAPQVTSIDTTAAGDCFNGALAVGLSESQPIDEAVAFACKAASISVTRMGAQASLPYRKEVNEISLITNTSGT
jgi:ribokinase